MMLISWKKIEDTWKDFVFSRHYVITKSIFDSYLFTHPRRSCEAFAMATLQLSHWRDNKYPAFEKLEDFHEWIKPLLAEEMNGHFTGSPCPPV